MARNKQKQDKRFTTLELHLASYPNYRGIHIDLENLNGQVIITAHESGELYRLIHACDANASVSVRDYVDIHTAPQGRYAGKEARRG